MDKEVHTYEPTSYELSTCLYQIGGRPADHQPESPERYYFYEFNFLYKYICEYLVAMKKNNVIKSARRRF